MAHAVSRVLKRLADKGWVASTTIRPGRLGIEYTDLGKSRMRTLKSIFIEELHVALTDEEFQALIGLLLVFDKKPGDAGGEGESK